MELAALVALIGIVVFILIVIGISYLIKQINKKS